MRTVKVLIVEDNPMNLELASDLLEIAGFTVIDAGDGASGISLAKRERPDIILMDIDLPGMNGLEATQRIRQDPELQSIPVVALTAFAMQKDIDSAMAAGCTGYLTKPIDTRSFSSEVARFLGERQG